MESLSSFKNFVIHVTLALVLAVVAEKREITKLTSNPAPPPFQQHHHQNIRYSANISCLL